jgi:hypothetical protein
LDLRSSSGRAALIMVAGALVVVLAGLVAVLALRSDDPVVEDLDEAAPAAPSSTITVPSGIDTTTGSTTTSTTTGEESPSYRNAAGSYFSTYGAPPEAMTWTRSETLLFNQPLPADTPALPQSAAIATRIDEVIRGERLYDYGSGIEDDVNAPLMLLVDSEVEEFTEVRFRPQACGADTWWNWNADHFEPYINGAYADVGATGIPVPADFQMSAEDSDSHLVIYDWRRDRLIELWHTKTSNLTGSSGIEVCWGGIIDDYASSSTGIFPFPMGVFAAGVASPGLMITLSDLQQGEIRHAVAVSSAIAIDNEDGASMSWPANRNDGSCATTPSDDYSRHVTDSMDGVEHCLYEGQYLRFPADYDIDSLTHPYARMLATAVRDYGLVLVDEAGCFCFQAESGLTPTVNGMTTANPWDEFFAGTPEWDVLWEIDWTELEVLPRDWGKPAGYRIACTVPPGTDAETNPMAGDPRCQAPVEPYVGG